MSLKDKIRSSIASALGLQTGGASPAGTRVLHPGPSNLFVTEHQNDQGQKVLQVAHMAGQGALVLELDGRDSSVTYFRSAPREPAPRGSGSLLYSPGSETAATQLYDQIKASIVSGPRPFGSSWLRRVGIATLWLLAGIGLIMMLNQNPSASTAASSAMAPPQAPVAAPPAAATGERIPAEARASEQERTAVAALQGVIKSGAAGKPFYVFTDPNCPYCRQFEKTLESVPPGHQAVIIPLGYKEGSAATTVGVLCSANPAAEWRKAMLGQPSPQLKPCERGERLMRENMALFESLRLNRTPTILTPTNFFVSGAADAQELAMILGAGQP